MREKEKGLGGWKRRDEKGNVSSHFVILEELPIVHSAMVVVIEKPNVMTT